MTTPPTDTEHSVGVAWGEPVPGQFWRHFKGGVYQIVAVATVEATHDRVVVYKGSSGTWTRPMGEFLGTVCRDGYHGPRFVPEEIPAQMEIAALRRVIRSFVHGTIGKKDGHWWGACGFFEAPTLPELLKVLANQSEDSTAYNQELAVVEAALKEPFDG